MANASRDGNRVTTLLGVSSVDGTTPTAVYVDPTTHRMYVDIPGGTGTVTTVSVVSANGFAGTVANASSTPAITLTTSVTGIIKGNGTAISAATDGSDYLSSTTGVTVSQGTSQSIGDTTHRVTKLWATDVDVTNTITGSVSGNAATATALQNARTIGGVSFNGTANITVASATGGFTVTGGALAINDATTPSITLASGSTNTGNIQINGKTSGALKITTADATAQTVTLTVAAQTVGAATLTIPNMANTNKTIAWLESPSFTTPTLGAATATSINGLTITSSTGTLTITNLKTLTVSNSLTLAGTDGKGINVGAATSGKILIGDGTNMVLSANTFPNASATSGKIIKSDGTNWVASTETYAAPGTSGNVMTSDGTNWTSAAPSAPTGIGWSLKAHSGPTSGTTLTVSSLDLSTDLAYQIVVRVSAQGTTATNVRMTINGSSASNYYWGGQRILRSGGGSTLNTQGNDAVANFGLDGGNSRGAFLVTMDSAYVSLDGTTSRPIFVWQSVGVGNGGNTGGEHQYFSGDGYNDAQTNMTSLTITTTQTCNIEVWVYKRLTS